MITKILIENFRCFKKHEVDLKELNIIVGKNNAGKSSLIEALRIISVVVNRSVNLNFSTSPIWLNLQPQYKGVSPSLSNLDLSHQNICYNYSSPPAKLTVNFSNNCKTEVYINEELKVFGVITNSHGKICQSKKQVREANISQVKVLPQIGPISLEETVLTSETIRKNTDSYLASRHFRNQIGYNYKDFEKFVLLAEQSWKGLGIRPLDGRSLHQGSKLALIVHDGSFIAEIGWMGHGLQMWLQTMWFLARTDHNHTVILDEPDVYLHADLQRKLIRLVKGRYKQTIVATHSIEIISEVEPSNILILDKKNKSSEFANSISNVQLLVESLGSSQNIELIRLFSSKKLLIIEGNDADAKLLSIFQDTLFPTSENPIGSIPKTFLEGWGNWQRVIGSTKGFRDSGLKELSVFCILDSDYHLKNDIVSRYNDAHDHNFNLHIWNAKEIENYLIVPKAIQRYLRKNSNNSYPSLEELIMTLENLAESFKTDIIDNYATEIQSANRALATKTVNRKSRELVENKWAAGKFLLVPGKSFISSLSAWSQEAYKCPISKVALAREIKKSELDNELITVLKAIENNKPFAKIPQIL